MKTIEITDEMYDALMVISNELNTQSHRCTAIPYMIQLSEKKEVAAYEGCGEEFWFTEEGLRLDIDGENELVKSHLEEKHGSNYMSIYSELDDYDKEDILNDLNASKHEVTTEDKLSNFFFTDKGLRDYYGKDVNTFLTGVTNPELKTVMTFLCELKGGKLHR